MARHRHRRCRKKKHGDVILFYPPVAMLFCCRFAMHESWTRHEKSDACVVCVCMFLMHKEEEEEAG
jgi:hypothetical protein